MIVILNVDYPQGCLNKSTTFKERAKDALILDAPEGFRNDLQTVLVKGGIFGFDKKMYAEVLFQWLDKLLTEKEKILEYYVFLWMPKMELMGVRKELAKTSRPYKVSIFGYREP